MPKDRSVIARAVLKWGRERVEVSVTDAGKWSVPRGQKRLSAFLRDSFAIQPFQMPGRVSGEPAHDLLSHVVDTLGGRMLTRKLPIAATEEGAVY